MNKSELITRLAEESGTTQADAERVLTALVEVVGAAVADDDTVAIAGLGTFNRRSRSARQGRNPRTGETIEIAATQVPGFTAASALKRRVAGSKG